MMKAVAAKPQMTLLCVGKLRERFWQEAQAEYTKRLTAYSTKITVVEVADEPSADNASLADEESVRKREADRLLSRIGERDFVVVCDGSRGQAFMSERFAHRLEQAATDGASAWTFVIGGSLGLHETVLERANLAVSFGAFTFPHQLMRVVLLEQLYRAAKINRGEAYHK